MKKITKTLVAMLLAIAPLAGSAQGVDQFQEFMGYDTTNVINGWDANREDTVRVVPCSARWHSKTMLEATSLACR